MLARSWFHHSINYRSVVVLGDGARGHATGTRSSKRCGTSSTRSFPAAAADSRWADRDGELKATEMIAMSISEASAKVRIGNPIDLESDHALPTWAGQLPMSLVAGEPLADDYSTADVPGYVRALFNGQSVVPAQASPV